MLVVAKGTYGIHRFNFWKMFKIVSNFGDFQPGRKGVSSPHARVLFCVTHARLESLGFAVGDALAAPAFALLHALRLVHHGQ